MLLTEMIFVGGLMGGIPGGGLAGPVVTGVDQPYPHCNGITVMDPEAPIEEVHGTVVDVRDVHPCIGQPSYTLVHVDVGGRTMAVYLGPESFLADRGVAMARGDVFSGYAARTGDTLTALTLDMSGEVVALRDDQGRPLWNRPRLSH